MNTYAFICAKSNSKRLKHKNFLKINGKRLINYVFHNCKNSKIFKNIIISSNKKININDKKFIFHKRNTRLIKENVTVFDVCKKITQQFKLSPSDLVFVIYPTAILIDKELIKNSRKKFLNNNYDTLMGVSRVNYSPYKSIYKSSKGFYKPLFGSKILNKTKKDFYYSNGSFFLIKVSTLMKFKNFYTPKLGIFEVSNKKGCDVDTIEDLKILKKKLFKQL